MFVYSPVPDHHTLQTQIHQQNWVGLGLGCTVLRYHLSQTGAKPTGRKSASIRLLIGLSLCSAILRGNLQVWLECVSGTTRHWVAVWSIPFVDYNFL